ncbi:MAG TPA: MFS transporter [Paraburkholderia sp.]|uniref:MFS transporter n=1 Tax=Paraburkholderia sp. TaxID=1926495 RepID=UPI002B4A2BAE|nr:MFS transporter [Paraburkholderia sp.]HKR43748.1 MFS transporter [Paraburkholderia sp.]
MAKAQAAELLGESGRAMTPQKQARSGQNVTDSVEVSHAPAAATRRSWLALLVVCLSQAMLGINATITNVALPAIGRDLGLSQASLVWVVNAYLATFSGFLLLGGRLGDRYGHRPAFLLGTAIFTVASVICGVASSPGLLIVARGVQGVGSAIVIAVTLALITSLFTDVRERTRALSIRSFVAGSGNSIGLLLGGAVTSLLNWRWIFYMDVAVGVGIYMMCLAVLPHDSGGAERGRLGVAGSLVGTVGLILCVYVILEASGVGGLSASTLALIGLTGALLVAFIALEARASMPLMPRRIIRQSSFLAASAVGALVASAVLAWNVFGALYLQRLMRLDALHIGLAFLPATALIALVSVVLVPRLVARWGAVRPLVSGLLIAATGMTLLVRASVAGHVLFHAFPGMLLIGVGIGLTYAPLLLVALSGVSRADSGAASGMISAVYAIGAVLGLASVAGLASARTDKLFATGSNLQHALTSGYAAALGASAGSLVLAAVISAVFVRSLPPPQAPDRNCAACEVSGRPGANRAGIRPQGEAG